MRSLTVPAQRAALERVLAFLEAGMEEAGASPRAQVQLAIAAEEIFVNIASYAYPGGAGTATVEYAAADGEITVCFRDAGVPYDPLAREDPDVHADATKRDIGGLGVYMVKKSMDAVSYARENGQNVFTMQKRW